MSTSGTILIVLVVLVAVIVVLGALAWTRMGKSRRLQQRFGPEYERTVQETGSKEEAERVLDERLQHYKDLKLRDLDPAAREAFVTDWRGVQTRFVDDPKGAVAQADELVTRLMRDLGFPAESFEQQVADISVEHADTVPNYRRAHELATARAEAATDDLRQAMLHYRQLFEQLLGQPAWQPDGAAQPPEATAEPAPEVAPETTPETPREVR